jgi:hypothetical protein
MPPIEEESVRCSSQVTGVFIPARMNLDLSIRDVGGGKRQTGPTGTPSYDASALIDTVEPVIKVQFCLCPISLRGVARVSPMKCAPGLLAIGIAIEKRFSADILAFTRLADDPTQGVRVSVVKGVNFSEGDCLRCNIPFTNSGNGRALLQAAH